MLRKESPYKDKNGKVICDGHVLLHSSNARYVKDNKPDYCLVDIVEFREDMIDDGSDNPYEKCDGWGYGNYHASFIPFKEGELNQYTIIGEVIDLESSDYIVYKS